MKHSQVIYRPLVAFVVCPVHRFARFPGFEVCNGIFIQGAAAAVLAAFQLVPGIVGQAVSVTVLHHPDNAGLRRIFVGIAGNQQIVFPVVYYAVVKTGNKVPAISSQGNKITFF